jgi:hypothetical protein
MGDHPIMSKAILGAVESLSAMNAPRGTGEPSAPCTSVTVKVARATSLPCYLAPPPSTIPEWGANSAATLRARGQLEA